MYRHPLVVVATLLAASLLLSSCNTLKGVKIGDVSLDPFVSAAEKMAASGEMSEPDEIALGSHMAGTLLGAATLDPDLAAQRYVNQVGRWLTLHGNRSDLPWKFGVLNDATINAFAAPGGYVFITRGLLDVLDSEAELAGVLAHEIQHVEHKHHLIAVQKNNQLGAATDVLGYLGSQQLAKGGGDYAGAKTAVADAVIGATKTLYARGLDKEDEFAADRDALTLTSHAGYDPYAFLAVLQKLQARSSETASLALLLKTHPQPTARLQALETSPALNASGSFADNGPRFRKALKRGG